MTVSFRFRQLSVVTLSIFTLLLAAMPARSAVLISKPEIVAGKGIVFTVSGSIESGDAWHVAAAFASVPSTQDRTARLETAGGSIGEALRIGRFFHANGVRTEVVGKGRSCVGACALVFLGGRGRDGAASRLKGSEAQLGLHAMRRNVQDREYMVSDMHEALASTQRVLLAIADYMTAVGADVEVMALMLDKPYGQTTYIHNEQALQLGVDVLDEGTGDIQRARPPRR